MQRKDVGKVVFSSIMYVRNDDCPCIRLLNSTNGYDGGPIVKQFHEQGRILDDGE